MKISLLSLSLKSPKIHLLRFEYFFIPNNFFGRLYKPDFINSLSEKIKVSLLEVDSKDEVSLEQYD